MRNPQQTYDSADTDVGETQRNMVKIMTLCFFTESQEATKRLFPFVEVVLKNGQNIGEDDVCCGTHCVRSQKWSIKFPIN